jgi:hypothetical protein
MRSDTKNPVNVNVALSLKQIQRYFGALSSGTVASDLGTMKENAEAALEYLNHAFNTTVGDMLTASLCAPRPKIPD